MLYAHLVPMIALTLENVLILLLLLFLYNSPNFLWYRIFCTLVSHPGPSPVENKAPIHSINPTRKDNYKLYPLVI